MRIHEFSKSNKKYVIMYDKENDLFYVSERLSVHSLATFRKTRRLTTKCEFDYSITEFDMYRQVANFDHQATIVTVAEFIVQVYLNIKEGHSKRN